MLAGGSERWVHIADGPEGSAQTLDRMRLLIHTPDPLVDAMATVMAKLSPQQMFEWVRRHMLYTPDFNNGEIIEEIKSPGYLLREIRTFGRAFGDCDDYVVLLGALYIRLGHDVRLVAISRHADHLFDHVFLTVNGITADGIVAEPFGWEVPANEVTNRMELAV